MGVWQQFLSNWKDTKQYQDFLSIILEYGTHNNRFPLQKGRFLLFQWKKKP